MKIKNITDIIYLKYHDLMSYKEGSRERSLAGIMLPPSPSDTFLRNFSFTTLSYLDDEHWAKIISPKLRDVTIDSRKKSLSLQLFDRIFCTIMIRLLRDYSAATCFNRMFHSNRHHQIPVRRFLTDNNYLERDGKITSREDLTIETLVSQLDSFMTFLQTPPRTVNPNGTLKELADFAKFLNAIQIEIKRDVDLAVPSPVTHTGITITL